jgi:Stage II sporulation protein E (SpoIIE)/GAF domain
VRSDLAGSFDADESLGLLNALFAADTFGLAFYDAELRLRRLDARIEAVLPELDAELTAQLRAALEDGEPVVGGDVIYHPVFGTLGQPLGIAAVLTEPLLASERRARAEAEAAHARTAFLAEASKTLESSLDQDVTLRAVGTLVVPAQADWFAVDVLDPDGSIRRVAVAHADSTKERLGWELAERFPASIEDAAGFGRSIREGCSELLSRIDNRMLERIAGGRLEYAQALRDVGLRSTMIVPLRARGRTLGAMLLAIAESGRRFDAADLILAEELGARIAMAMENARLYRERTESARTLQASLLPPVLPAVAGLDVAARYHAVGEGNDVGGDFYDVFAAGDGWAAFLGDVSGKGPRAAVVTALARHTLRAIALHETDPAAILAALNATLLRVHEGDEFCTAVYARFDAVESERVELTISVAGHPPPLIARAGGGVDAVAVRGTLLGVTDELRLESERVELRRGDTLLLYTDGVEERGLAKLVDRVHGETLSAFLAAVERHAVCGPDGEPRDDIALVAVRAGS